MSSRQTSVPLMMFLGPSNHPSWLESYFLNKSQIGQEVNQHFWLKTAAQAIGVIESKSNVEMEIFIQTPVQPRGRSQK